MKIKKLLILTTIIMILLLANTSAQKFYAPLIDEETTINQDLQGNIQLNNTQNPRVQIILQNETIKEFNINSQGDFTIPKEYLLLQGIYKIRFRDGQTYFPEENYFNIYINREKNNYEENYQKIKLNDTSQPFYCQPYQEEYNCKVEHFQAYEIARFSKILYETNNEDYRTKLNYLINSSWVNGFNPDFCDPKINFNCDEITEDELSGITYTGANRQGIIIRELWIAYAYTKNQTIYALATNFSQGSAQECDVHNNDYDCGNSADQGLMIQGYAEAYKNSGKTEYLTILNNLINAANKANPSSELIHGFIIARPFISGLEEDIKNMLDLLNSCESCNELDIVTKQLMLLEAYKQDFLIQEKNEEYHNYNYKTYRKLFDAFSLNNNNCGHITEIHSCQTPEIQVLKKRLYQELTHNTFHANNGFYDARITATPLGGLSNISIKFLGEVKNPQVHLRNFLNEADSFDNYTLNKNGFLELNDSITISGSIFSELGSTFVQIYFTDNETRYPEQNYLILPIYMEAPSNKFYEDIITENPRLFCEPFSAQPTYSCLYEYMQGKYLQSLSKVINTPIAETILSKVQELYAAVIDFTNPREFSTCDPNVNDYVCEDVQEDPQHAKKGVYRASALAGGYLEAYKKTQEPRLLRDAQILMHQTWSSCSLINNDFDCEEENRGKILETITQLYELTGDTQYKDWMNQLILNTNNQTLSEVLGLTKAYPYTTNPSLKEYIEIAIQNLTEPCTNQNQCNTESFYYALTLAWDAYKTFNNETYFQRGSDLLISKPQGSIYCMPLEATLPENNVCNLPSEQGIMINAFTTVKENFVIPDAPDLILEITGPEEGDLHETIQINCTVENIDSKITLIRANMGLATNQEIISSTPTSREIINLAPNQSATISFLINLTQGGRSNNRCQILNYESSQPINVTNIGEIFNITYSEYVNEQNDYELKINITNKHTFRLENVEINLSGAPFGIIKKIDSEEITNQINRALVDAQEVIEITYLFENHSDDEFNITINASADFEGLTNKILSVKVIKNNIQTQKQQYSLRLYEETEIEINITNNKTINLQEINFTLINPQDFNIISISKQNFNLTSQNSTTIKINLSATSPNITELNFSIQSIEGLNITDNFSFIILQDILDIQGNNVITNINTPTNITFKIINIAEINQTQINVTLNATNELNLTKIYFEDDFEDYELHEIINTTLETNKTEFIENITSQINNVTITIQDYLTFNLSANITNKVKNSTLKINYTIENATTNISIHQNNQTTYLCTLTNITNIKECVLEIDAGELEIIFEINGTGNLTINLLEINNTVLVPRNRINEIAGNIVLDYLHIGEEITIKQEGFILTNNQQLLINATSQENGLATHKIEINTPQTQDSTGGTDTGGGAGGGGAVEQINETNQTTTETWQYEKINTIEKFLENKDIKEYFENKNITLNFEYSQNKSQCLNITRTYKQDTKIMTLTLKNICEDTLYEIFILEPIQNAVFLEDYDYAQFREGTLIKLDELKYNETKKIIYEVVLLNKEGFNEIYLHVQGREEKKDIVLEEEPAQEIQIIEKNKIFTFLIILISVFLLMTLIINIQNNKHKYLLIYKKQIHALQRETRQKTTNISSLDQTIMDTNLKLNYLNALITDKKINSAKQLLLDIIIIYKKVEKTTQTEKQKEQIKFIKNKILEIITTINEPNKNTQEQNKNQKVKKLKELTEQDIFLRMLKIEKLIEDEEIYEAKELSKQLEEKINQLGEEKEKEKEFLLQKLEPFTTKIDNIIITQFFEDPNIELKEEGTREELDLFTNLLKIEDLITQNKLDEAQEYLDKNKRKINQLDEEEKKKEKEFLIKKITKMEQTLEKIKETSKKYKIKKYLQEKKEQLTNIFKKEDE